MKLAKIVHEVIKERYGYFIQTYISDENSGSTMTEEEKEDACQMVGEEMLRRVIVKEMACLTKGDIVDILDEKYPGIDIFD